MTTIRAGLGHSDLETTQRYMHYYAPAADEAERVERAFAIDDSEQGRRDRPLPLRNERTA